MTPARSRPPGRPRGRERGDFEAPQPAEGQPCVYVKPSSPFTSGNLHMGHVRDYAIGDAYARFRRARGDAVLFGFGFDAFGLPAELAAIERHEPPAEWVGRSGERMLGQMKRLGFSFDYDRVFYSSDEGQYRWSQWLFLTLLEAGLIYRDDATVDWCDNCQTTLAALQVEDGRCWRCHNEVRLIRRPTWFLRIAPYLEENDRNLGELENWDELSLATQRYILGRTDGVELDLSGPGGRALTVFTPHRDAVGEARFVLLSPRHPEVEQWVRRRGVSERAGRAALGRLGAQRPRRLGGAGDRHRRVGGRARPAASCRSSSRRSSTPATGRPRRSAFPPSTRPTRRSRRRMPRTPSRPAGAGRVDLALSAREAKRYRASDFSISRQRYWGTPIPIVHCEALRCGPGAVRGAAGACCRATSSRPAKGTRSPSVPTSSTSPARSAASPPSARPTPSTATSTRCGSGFRPPCRRRPGTTEMFDHPDLKRWLPAERLVAGSDSGGFVFDQRVVTKALRDIGPFAFLEDGEPFAGCLFHEMVIADGRKMSKHLGNVVDPDELVEQYGADTVRLAVLYAAGPAKTLNWNDGAIRFARRFLTGLWDYSHERFAAARGGAGRRRGGRRHRVPA